MKPFFIYLLFGVFFILTGFLRVSAQTAPITTIATVGNAAPGSIDVPITVTGFNNIGAVSLTIDYDYAVMHFNGGVANPALPSFPTGEIDLGGGLHRITMGWFGPGTTLADSSTIMTLNFTFIAGITELSFYDNGPSCEYADANFNVLPDTPQETFYINGNVCGLVGNPGPIYGDSIVCGGQTGVIYSVNPIVNATGYAWDLQDGAVIVNGDNTNAITVDFNDFAVSGDISVYGFNACSDGPLSYQTVIVSGRPVANAGNDTTINYGTSTTLHAAGGGNEVYSYHWSPEELLVDPDVQNPQTEILTETTIFTVLVTNQMTFCQNSDQVIVTITGGPLSANPIAVPPQLCAGSSSHLFSNAGGGSGTYTFWWTSTPPGNPPWSSTEANPVVMPGVSTRYHLTLNDGFLTIIDSVLVSVMPLPTATISGGDTLCGENVYTELQVDLTGTPPWSITYSYSNTSVFVNDISVSPYFFIASDPGDYIITSVEDTYCDGTTSGTAIVRKYPIPEKPEITVYFTELISSACCGNQWYKDGNLIPGATGQTYQVTINGEYFTIVTINACSSEPSDTVDMIVGVEEYQSGQLNFYPNPANDHISVILPSSKGDDYALSLYSSSGKLIRFIEIKKSDREIIIDLTSLPKGMYFITLTGKRQTRAGKLIR